MASVYVSFDALGVSEFCDWIRRCPDYDFYDTVVDEFRSNGIDGSRVFMLLTTEELKELAPRLADRVALRKIQSTVRCMCVH